MHGFASKEQRVYPYGGYSSETLQNGFGILQFGGDYVINLGTPSKGAYFLAGLNLNQVTKTLKVSGYEDESATQSGRMGVRIGAGVACWFSAVSARGPIWRGLADRVRRASPPPAEGDVVRQP